jgi:hypothetical protein
MSDTLTQRLERLAASLEYPPTPDVVPATLARLPERSPGARRRTVRARRALTAALAALLLLGGAAFAITPSRHAILDVLGLRGVEIERVPHLPPGLSRRPAGLGERIPVSSARHAAAFTAILPSGVTTAYLDRGIPGGRITLLAGRLLITEFHARAFPVIYKLIAAGTQHRQLRLHGGPAVYLFGAPSELIVIDAHGTARTVRVRRAGNVLIWQRGPVTILIEGTRTLTEAVTAARSLR